MAPDPVSDVDDLHLGAIILMTPWQVPTKSSARPKSLRKVMNLWSVMMAPECQL